MSLYIAAYDSSRDSARSQVAKVLLGYGRRVQESVFEIDLEPEDLPDLKRAVGPWLAVTDHFDLFPIDRRHPEQRVRWQRPPYPEPVQLF
jgi:CRISPR-associated protein Cas2